jgi:hypothetical protein
MSWLDCSVSSAPTMSVHHVAVEQNRTTDGLPGLANRKKPSVMIDQLEGWCRLPHGHFTIGMHRQTWMGRPLLTSSSLLSSPAYHAEYQPTSDEHGLGSSPAGSAYLYLRHSALNSTSIQRLQAW